MTTEADSASIPIAAQAAALATEPPKEEQEKTTYVNVQHLLDTEMKEIFVLNDIPVLIEIPNVVIGDAPEIVERKSEPARIIPVIRTPRRQPVVEPEFSIYAVSFTSLSEHVLEPEQPVCSVIQHPSSPLLNKAMYITPVRQAFLTSGDVDLTLLRAASERVSEILQENRRRVDAGEDPSTVRSMSSESFSRMSSQPFDFLDRGGASQTCAGDLDCSSEYRKRAFGFGALKFSIPCFQCALSSH